MKIRVKSFSLREANLDWIAQITITSDGMFACISEYGNFSFAWRHTGEKDFRVFLSGCNKGYFGGKMYQGMAYITSTRKVEKACDRFADKVFPILAEALKNDIEENPVF